MSCKCNLGNVEIRPDGVHSLDCCIYEDIEMYANVTVIVSRCKNCGHIELFEPSLDSYARHLREETEKRRQEEEAARKAELEKMEEKERQERERAEEEAKRILNEAIKRDLHRKSLFL